MKQILKLGAIIIFLFSFVVPAQSAIVTFDEFASAPSSQNPSTPYYDNPITNEYANKGIYFVSGHNGLFGGDIFNATNWPNSDFPVNAPTSQYLSLDKPKGATVTTGIKINFDNLCTYLSFETRRPGGRLDAVAEISAIFYNTRVGATQIDAKSFTAYNDPSQYGISDDDAWINYTWDQLPAFNSVLFFSSKKFAIDNLVYSYGQPVPVPTAFLLLASGLIGFSGFRRRQKEE